MLIEPLQTPPVHADPADRAVFEQTPAEHASVVHVLPSLQSAGLRHCTQTRVGPEVSQTGVPAVQPKSIIVPEAVSRQGRHMGALIAPSHTPEGHTAPCESDGFEHTLEVQRSLVQTLPSLQSLPTMQRTHAGIAPDVSHIGVAALHPVSVIVPVRSLTHATHAGLAIDPLQMPPVHGVPVACVVFEQVPDEHASAVHWLLSLHCAELRHWTHTADPLDVSQMGRATVHPVSRMTPVASSTQPTNAGSMGGAHRPAPVRQMPVGHIDPIVQLAGLPSTHT